jgi:hypothetical protein
MSFGGGRTARALILTEIRVRHRAAFVEETMRSLRSYLAPTTAARSFNRPSDWRHLCACGFSQLKKKPEPGLTSRLD